MASAHTTRAAPALPEPRSSRSRRTCCTAVVGTVRNGAEIEIPTHLKPSDFDWTKSRPRKPWQRHGRSALDSAMVALVTRGTDGTPMAVHRTFLAPDGRIKAPVEPAKIMLGPCRGGAVRLGPAGDRLMIAEGIETALSAIQATGQPAWAALSTSGLRTLELPADVGDVVVLPDGDQPGEAAAHDAGRRWKREGRRVRIARPSWGFDFNDVLRGRAFCRVEEAV